MRDMPRPGQIYRHFKGNIYRIITIATHTETGERFVIYKREDQEDKSYARPLEMFMSEVDRKKYPEVREKYRFTLCSEDALSDLLGEDAVYAAASEGSLNPLLEAFLDASSISDKVDRFYDMRKIADEEMLRFVAASLDMDVTGDVQDMYQEILRALKAREKYESSRLRRQ
ncbi:MAG: DUF1653 domain-containing protein [Lachnospiraceae bacterium]|nr:DUF1653 domain-containing protein [Lachnospiraceae bacterium]